MAGSVTKSLYLQIGGDVTALTTAAKAGKSVLLSLGDAAVDVQDEVKRAFADLGNSIPDQAKQIERSYADTFAAIRRNAQSVLDAPDSHAAVQVINAGAANDAAAAAEKQAVALRQVAVAASTVADRAGAAGAAERVLAVASAAVAERAEEEALALRSQATLLGTVEAEIRATAGGVDDASNKVVAAHGRMGASGAILQHVVRSTTDSFAAGLPVSIIFAEQVGRLGEAAALSAQEGEQAGGAFAKFAGVMSGPWGLAITAGISVAAQLVSHVLATKDALGEETEKLEQNAKQAAVSEQAKAAFLHTEAGAADDIRAVTAELKKQNDELRTNAELLNNRAKADLAQSLRERAEVSKQLSAAKSSAAGTLGTPGGGVAGDPTLFIKDQADDKVASLEDKLKKINADIANARANIVNSARDLDAEAAKRLADPLEGIKQKYEGADGLIEQAKKQATAEEVVNGVLTRRLFILNQQEKAETEAEQKRQAAAKKTPDDRQIGRQVTLDQAEDIVRGVGGRITSAQRSTSKQAELYARYQAGDGPLAAKPGTSLHETGEALDVAKSVGVTLATLKKAFADAGVHLTEALDEGDHYHVGFGKKGPSAETEARRAQAKVAKAANDDRAFTNADKQADDAIARAKLQISDSIETEYQIRIAQIDAETAAKDHAIQDEVTAGKLTQAQADQLKLKNDELGVLEEQIASDKRRVALAEAAYQTDRDERTGRLALLQIDASIAGTRRERLAAERKILDEQQAQRRADLKLTVDTSKDPDAVKRAQADTARLPNFEKAENKQFDQGHLDPLASYTKQLHDNVGDLNDALKGVEADGLKGVEDGLLGIVEGTETVADAAKKMAESIIADLARIAIEKAVLAVFGYSSGGEVGSVSPEKHAGGGFISGAGSGTSDDILSWLSNGEFVMNAAATRKHLPLLKAINDDDLPGYATGGLVGGLPNVPTGYPTMPRAEQLRGNGPAPVIHMHNNFQGAVVTQDLIDHANAAANQAYKASVEHTNASFTSFARARL